MKLINNIIKATGVALAVAGGFTLAVSIALPNPAFAGNGNGNGNGNGGGNGNGEIASELKWRNAAHANEKARMNSNGRPSMFNGIGTLDELLNMTEDQKIAAFPKDECVPVEPEAEGDPTEECTVVLDEDAYNDAIADADGGVGFQELTAAAQERLKELLGLN